MCNTRPLGTHVKHYKRVFLETVFSKRWDLYLQKLLSDSTDTFFILKNILLAGGDTRNKKKKIENLYVSTALKGWKIYGKGDFKLQVSLFSKKM